MAAIEARHSSSQELVPFDPYKDVLPPKTTVDIWNFFLLHEERGEYPGYASCAEKLSDVLDLVVIKGDEAPREAFNLPLTVTKDGDVAIEVTGEIPEATRALLELTYRMVGAEIVGERSINGQDIIYLHGVHEDIPIEFAEIHTRVPEGLSMHWTVKRDQIGELQEHSWERATFGEMRDLLDTTVDTIIELPESPQSV